MERLISNSRINIYGKSAARLAALTVAYYVAAVAGLVLLTQTNNIALVWPATAILLVYLLKTEPSEWILPLLLCWGGGILANVTMDTQLPIGVMLSLTGTDIFLDGLLAAFLLCRFANPETLFQSVRGVTAFLLHACIIAPAVGGVWGGGTIAVAFGAPFGPEWFKWWISTAISVAIFAPALMTFSVERTRAVLRGTALTEVIALFVAALGVSALIFLTDFAGLLFLVIPLLLWPMLRFGVAGVSWIGTLLATVAIAFTVIGLGPVAAMHDDLVDQVGFLQLFLMATYIPALICAVVLRQRMAAESALRQAQKMEAVGQLTGGIAHDFNNLLTILIGNIEIVRDRIGSDSLSRERLQSALNAVERGADLTYRLLAFSRQQPLLPVELDINESVQHIEKLLERTLGEEIELKFIEGANMWHCQVDPSQLENTILNLALNARDAMPNGGRLTIETDNTHLDSAEAAGQIGAEQGDYVMLSVSDTGVGMPDEIRDRVFEPFFTTKAMGEGSGLGLSMVQGFVAQSGGYIKIYSEPGQGTAVKIFLPRLKSRTEDPAPQIGDEEVMSGAGRSILLVEDDADVRALTNMLLIDLGYRVHEAATAQEALDMVNRGVEVDLLLTDVVLPGGLGGRELAGQMSLLLPNLPVLFMSGYSANSVIHEGRLDAGVNLLSKPFRKVDLARALQQAFAQNNQ